MSMSQDYDYSRNEPALIYLKNCDIQAETPKALLVRQQLPKVVEGVIEHYREAWFPKSRSEINPLDREFAYEDWLTPSWKKVSGKNSLITDTLDLPIFDNL